MQKSNPLSLYLMGGLGNQLFQYATAYSYAKKYNLELQINVDSYAWVEPSWKNSISFQLNNVFEGLKISDKSLWTKLFFKSKYFMFIGKIARKLFWLKGNTYVEKISYNYDEKLFSDQNYDGLLGYFQSYKYFENEKPEILKQARMNICSDGGLFYKKLILNSRKSVGIHYRDYEHPDTGNIDVKNSMGIIDFNYYAEAIRIIRKKERSIQCFVFSNNTDLAKKKLVGLENPIFVNYQTEYDWEDMALMSICDHNIISNSSYSWWSAYLNDSPGRTIIAPKNWGKKIIGKKDQENFFPSRWILI